MKAFILAAGFGKRMGDLTLSLPKPLLPLQGFPLITFTLFQLHLWKIEEAVINVHYLGDKIVDYLKDFPHFPLHFSREPEILGTAGGLAAALDHFEGESSFLLINPDAVFLPHAFDLPGIGAKAMRDEVDALLYLLPKPAGSTETGWSFRASGGPGVGVSGVPACDAQDIRLIDFIPGGGEFFYTGYSLINPESLQALDKTSFAELGPIWKDASGQGRVLGKVFKGDMYDVGRREAYEALGKQVIIEPDLADAWQEFVAGWDAGV